MIFQNTIRNAARSFLLPLPPPITFRTLLLKQKVHDFPGPVGTLLLNLSLNASGKSLYQLKKLYISASFIFQSVQTPELGIPLAANHHVLPHSFKSEDSNNLASLTSREKKSWSSGCRTDFHFTSKTDVPLQKLLPNQNVILYMNDIDKQPTP